MSHASVLSCLACTHLVPCLLPVSNWTGELATRELKVKLFDAIPGKAAMAIKELDDRLPELNACGVVEGHCNFSVSILIL